CTGNADDDNGHGTHVAGIIGALDNDLGIVGVAPGARLWAVKVLDSSGSGANSGILAGIDWVVAQGDIEVINMSLGSKEGKSPFLQQISQATNDAINAAVNVGITVVVAAGNSADDAADYTPANAPDAITVSALADFDGLPGGLAGSTCR
ncbi:unnamed protein product, partial [Cyprideis torosa]